jgi:hypothetical protein
VILNHSPRHLLHYLDLAPLGIIFRSYFEAASFQAYGFHLVRQIVIDPPPRTKSDFKLRNFGDAVVITIAPLASIHSGASSAFCFLVLCVFIAGEAVRFHSAIPEES